jgi:2'-5' RNA ligase
MSIRLFVALELPADFRQRLTHLQTGIPDANWVAEENFHLTLRFIGEVPGSSFESIATSLESLSAPGFSIEPCGLNHFGSKQPRAIWVAIKDCPSLLHLAKKIETALQRTGLAPEQRKFTPHITLARLKNATPQRIGSYLSANGDFAYPPIEVDHFTLFSSILGQSGPTYHVEHHYPLQKALK